MFDDRVDFLFAADVMADGQFGRTVSGLGSTGIVRDVIALPDRKLQARLQIEEGDGAVLELRANDALCWKTKSIAIEPKR